MARICIPKSEYKERVQRCAEILRREKLDVLIVNGNEADYANPRYFSGFWPLFERSGVAVAVEHRYPVEQMARVDHQRRQRHRRQRCAVCHQRHGDAGKCQIHFIMLYHRIKCVGTAHVDNIARIPDQERNVNVGI